MYARAVTKSDWMRDTWTPISRCTPEHSIQMMTPKLVDNHEASKRWIHNWIRNLKNTTISFFSFFVLLPTLLFLNNKLLSSYQQTNNGCVAAALRRTLKTQPSKSVGPYYGWDIIQLWLWKNKRSLSWQSFTKNEWRALLSFNIQEKARGFHVSN